MHLSPAQLLAMTAFAQVQGITPIIQEDNKKTTKEKHKAIKKLFADDVRLFGTKKHFIPKHASQHQPKSQKNRRRGT